RSNRNITIQLTLHVDAERTGKRTERAELKIRKADIKSVIPIRRNNTVQPGHLLPACQLKPVDARFSPGKIKTDFFFQLPFFMIDQNKRREQAQAGRLSLPEFNKTIQIQLIGRVNIR